MRILDKHPSMRWIAPLAALAVAGGSVFAANTASADVVLPKLSTQQLVAKVSQAKVQDLSGSVTETADLGLPSLPVSNGEGSTDFTALLSGTNTLQVWNAGETKSRVMLSGTFGESDVVRNGASVWSWNSKAKTATHATLPSRTSKTPRPAAELPKTPQDAAKQALAAIDGSTTVTLDRNQMVAGQKAYELVLTPKSTSTLVGSVRIAVDGATYLPLRVDMFAKSNATKPAFEVAYTKISYATPADSVFAFSPPADAKVTEKSAPKAAGHPGSLHGTKGNAPTKAQQQKASQAISDDVKTFGTGWSSAVVAKLPAASLTSGQTGQKAPGRHQDSGNTAGQLQQTLNALPAVQGKGWTGHALNGTLFSVVVTSDNRVAIGSVSVGQLVKDLG